MNFAVWEQDCSCPVLCCLWATLLDIFIYKQANEQTKTTTTKQVGPGLEETPQDAIVGKRFAKHRKNTSFPKQPVSSDYLVELFPKFYCLTEQIPGKVAFLSTEGKRQVPLNEEFLRRCPSADLKPEEILISVNIPHSRKVRTFFQSPAFTMSLQLVNSNIGELRKGVDYLQGRLQYS